MQTGIFFASAKFWYLFSVSPAGYPAGCYGYFQSDFSLSVKLADVYILHILLRDISRFDVFLLSYKLVFV